MNSLLQGKIQGILAVLSRIGRSCCRYASIFASDLDQIPYVQEQGIFATKHGTSTREQGGDSAAAGNESDLAPQVNRLDLQLQERLEAIVPTSPLADLTARIKDVRFAPTIGHAERRHPGPLSANSR